MIVRTERCTGCGECVAVCPEGAISLVGPFAEIDPTLCTDCGACPQVCPEEAIAHTYPERPYRAIAPAPVITILQPALPTAQRKAGLLSLIGGGLALTAQEALPRLGAALARLVERRLSAADEPAPPLQPSAGDPGRRQRRRQRGGR
ncbi:MAG: 4Fe-4S binding protein [Chloroflexi bacterium]|nr:4Fe-4S binding protein [Chloroflexota bacterium]